MSMMARKIFFPLLMVIMSYGSWAQQFPSLSQYMFNKVIINPAYTGHDEALSLTFANRWQWVGVEGAPVTQTFSAHTYLPNQKVGGGLVIVNDKIGVHQNLRALATAAYRLSLTSKSSLSFGLQLGVNHRRSGYSALSNTSAIDPLSSQQINQTGLSVGFGLYYIHRDWAAGLSIPELRNQSFNLHDSLNATWKQRQVVLFIQRKFQLQSNVAFEPSILLRYLPSLKPSLDINASVIFYDVFTTGLAYRTQESLAWLAKFQITPQLQAGYSFDYVLSSARALSRSSHELMIHYRFRFVKHNVTSPR